MLSTKVKEELSQKIQAMLQEIDDEELPDGEISFILHNWICSGINPRIFYIIWSRIHFWNYFWIMRYDYL